MAIDNRMFVKNGSKKEVVKYYIQKPQVVEVYYRRYENPENNWQNFLYYIKRCYPIKKRNRIFIKTLTDDFN